jgi:hypothetical protein
MNKKNKAWFVLGVSAAAFAFAGCGDDDDGNSDGTGGSVAPMGGNGGSSGGKGGSAGSSAAGGKGGSGGSDSGGKAGSDSTGEGGSGGAGEPGARVRVMHLSPDAPAVDVFVNGADAPVVSELEFPDGTPYLEVPAGTYDFAVSAAGTGADEAVLSIDDLELSAGVSYTAVAYDELSSITALPLVDDYSGLASGKIRVRVVHTAEAVGQVDVWNIPESGDPTPIWSDLDFGSAGEAVDLDAGSYTVGVDVDDDETPDLTFVLPALDAGVVVNVFAVNDADDAVFLIAELPDGSTARIDPEPSE